jgi:hypothetical protein
MIYQTENIPFSFKQHRGGLNTNGNPLNIKDEESSALQNIDFDKFGALMKRKGYDTINPGAPIGGWKVGFPIGILLVWTRNSGEGGPP